jgi:hypothetical protein
MDIKNFCLEDIWLMLIYRLYRWRFSQRKLSGVWMSWSNAKAELGLGSNEPLVRPVRGRPRGKTLKAGRNPSMSAAGTERWSGWKAYKAKHPGATSTDYFKARRAGKA